MRVELIDCLLMSTPAEHDSALVVHVLFKDRQDSEMKVAKNGLSNDAAFSTSQQYTVWLKCHVSQYVAET